MKNKRLLIITIIGLMAVLVMATSQVLAASPETTITKKTPPGQVRNPVVENTDEPEVDETGEPQGNGKPKGKNENYSGTITAISESSITIELKDASAVSALINENTRIRIPSNQDAGTEGLFVGASVKLLAVRSEDGTLTARAIQMNPSTPLKKYHVGVVTEYTASTSITIETKKGDASTFEINEDTVILPDDRQGELTIGSTVTIISPRTFTLEQTAAKIVIHPVSATEVVTDEDEDEEDEDNGGGPPVIPLPLPITPEP